MKPQREGGGNNHFIKSYCNISSFFFNVNWNHLFPPHFLGNNIYAKDIPPVLSKLSPSERSSYILMDLIKPPPIRNVILLQGEVIESEIISELGIFGIIIGKGREVLINETGGHLLRTKRKESEEGGVAAGYAVVDSPLLV